MTTRSLLVWTTGLVTGSVVTYYLLVNQQQQKKKKEQQQQEEEHTFLQLESVNLLSDLSRALWSNMNQALGKTIPASIEPSFADLPGPLASLKFTKFHLGNNPIRFDNILIQRSSSKNGVVKMDVDVLWDADCEIQLKADYFGKLGVEGIHLSGRLSFLLTPMDDVPVVSAIQYGFINRPKIDLDFSGLAQIADWKVLKNSILKTVSDSLADVLVLPCRSLYRMVDEISYYDLYQPPLGLCRVKLCNARGFEVERRRFGKDDIPDVYVNIGIGNQTFRSKTIENHCFPTWDETFDFILNDLDQIIRLEAWDEDGGALDPDDELGVAQTTVGHVLLQGKSTELELVLDNRPSGAYVKIEVDVLPLTTNLDSLLGGCGVIEIVIPKLQAPEPTSVQVECAGQKFVTGLASDDGILDAAYVVACQKELKSVKFSLLKNGTDEIGCTSVDLASLVDSPDCQLMDSRKIGEARLEFRVSLRGVEAPKKTSPRKSSTTKGELGAVRITALKGHGFRAGKKKRFRKQDIPDIYCIVKFGSNPTTWRTKTVKDSVEPEWNESKEFALQDHAQIIHVDVYDENRKGKDDTIGSARVAVGKVLLAGGKMEVEILNKGESTGAYITLTCDMLK